jgi:hypothetical protein
MTGDVEVRYPAVSVVDDEEAAKQLEVTVGTVKKSNAGITSR